MGFQKSSFSIYLGYLFIYYLFSVWLQVGLVGRWTLEGISFFQRGERIKFYITALLCNSVCFLWGHKNVTSPLKVTN